MHFRWEFIAAEEPLARGVVVVTDEARIAAAVAYFRFLAEALALDDTAFHDAMGSFPPSMAADAREEMQAYCDRCSPTEDRPVLVIRRSV